jgi:hypothetical protein
MKKGEVATDSSDRAFSSTQDCFTHTHEEFVNKYAPNIHKPQLDGTVQITLPKRFLLEKLRDELKGIDVANSPYHLNVFDIIVTEETSNFLVDFDKILTSCSHESPQFLNSWSTPRGIDNTAQNLVEVCCRGAYA